MRWWEWALAYVSGVSTGLAAWSFLDNAGVPGPVTLLVVFTDLGVCIFKRRVPASDYVDGDGPESIVSAG